MNRWGNSGFDEHIYIYIYTPQKKNISAYEGTIDGVELTWFLFKSIHISASE